MDNTIKEHFISLVSHINTNNLKEIGEITDVLLYNIIYLEDISRNYLSLLYKLIFHTKTEIACHILTEFVKFGQSDEGNAYKPLLDYFVIEAFKCLLKRDGCRIIKPCVILLRDYTNETLFKYIITCVVKQLKQDMLSDSPSNLSLNLPREKSFTWGWFSYVIARAYYSEPNKEKTTAKDIRKYMMLYRKMLTTLRKNAYEVVAPMPQEPTSYEPNSYAIEETWNGILNALETEKYQWVSDIINEVINDDEAACETVAASETAQPACETVAASETAPPACETVETVAACETAPPASETAPPASEAAPPKEKSWLYSLFGWS